MDYEDSFNSVHSLMKSKIQWGNDLLSFRWNHLFSDKLFSNTTLAYTSYRFDSFLDSEMTAQFVVDPVTPIIDSLHAFIGNTYSMQFEDYTAKLAYSYYLNPNIDFNWGAAAIQHRFNPGITAYYARMDTTDFSYSFKDETIVSNEFYAYAEMHLRLFDRLKLNLGIHQSAYAVNGELLFYPQARFSANYTCKNNL